MFRNSRCIVAELGLCIGCVNIQCWHFLENVSVRVKVQKSESLGKFAKGSYFELSMDEKVGKSVYCLIEGKLQLDAVADPGFPRRGGRGPRRRGCGLPRQLRFEHFVCQNERIGTLGGGTRRARPPRSANGMCFALMVLMCFIEIVGI